MSSGFNTNVQVGERTFHVQTEDRGRAHAKIDTVVYLQGRVVHRKSSAYADLPKGEASDDDALRTGVEGQHRQVIASLREGTLALDDYEIPREMPAKESPRHGISVKLLNARTWISRGHCDLQIEVLGGADFGTPIAGASVEAVLDAPTETLRFAKTCDDRGRAYIRFLLPETGLGAGTLVIRAKGAGGQDEIRFTFRAKAKT